MTPLEDDWRGKRALSQRAAMIQFHLRLLEDSEELDKKYGYQNYKSKCVTIQSLLKELQDLFLKMHAEGISNLPD
jgi:hypothetical protein